MSTIYDYTVQKADGTEVSLAEYKGKVLLIVNTASKCGLAPQFEGLQSLYDTYRDKGLVVLGFPSDQFKQELETSEEALEYCQMHYNVSFPIFAKIDVNGAEEHPLYTHLKKGEKGLLSQKIKWNFTKFLVDARGNVVKRYAPTTKPDAIAQDIEKLLD